MFTFVTLPRHVIFSLKGTGSRRKYLSLTIGVSQLLWAVKVESFNAT